MYALIAFVLNFWTSSVLISTRITCMHDKTPELSGNIQTMAEVKPLADVIYARHRDISNLTGDLTSIICTAINSIVPEEAVFAQKIKGVWLLYVKSDNARVTLLKLGKLTINTDVHLYLYDNNPFDRTRIQNERIVFKDLPVWECDSLVLNYLSGFPNISVVHDVQFSRSPTSNFLNGDRFVFIKGQCFPPLERNVMLGDYPVRIWHASQSKSCARCHHDDHNTSQTDKCVAYQQKQDDVEPFRHPSNVLSNYFPCKITFDGQAFNSAEHCYQWLKCTELMEPELAERVFKAPSAALAKQISSQMPVDKILTDWNNKKLDVMKKVLLAKLECCSLYRDVLLKSDTKVLVECTKDEYWGANLSHYLVKTTLPQYYPGKNKLGKLHMEIRQNLQSVSQQDLPNPANPPPSLQPGSKTAGLVSSAPVMGLDPTSSTGDPQPIMSTGQPPSPTSTKPSSPTVNLPSQLAQGTSTKLATGPPLSFSAAYLPSYPASEPSAVTSTAAPDGTGPSGPSVLSDDQLTGATAIQLRGSLKKLQNPKIDLLKLSGSSSSKVMKRQGRTPKKSSSMIRSSSLPPNINLDDIRHETRLITGYFSPSKVAKKSVSSSGATAPPSSTSRALPVEISVDDDAASVASSFGTCHEDSGSMDIEPDPDGI